MESALTRHKKHKFIHSQAFTKYYLMHFIIFVQCCSDKEEIFRLLNEFRIMAFPSLFRFFIYNFPPLMEEMEALTKMPWYFLSNYFPPFSRLYPLNLAAEINFPFFNEFEETSFFSILRISFFCQPKTNHKTWVKYII